MSVITSLITCMTDHVISLLLKTKGQTLALCFQVLCVSTVHYGSLTQEEISLFTIYFKAPTVKMNFQVGILKAVVFLQSPRDFKVEDMLKIVNQVQDYIFSRYRGNFRRFTL